jgi:hypothetical protein
VPSFLTHSHISLQTQLLLSFQSKTISAPSSSPTFSVTSAIHKLTLPRPPFFLVFFLLSCNKIIIINYQNQFPSNPLQSISLPLRFFFPSLSSIKQNNFIYAVPINQNSSCPYSSKQSQQPSVLTAQTISESQIITSIKKITSRPHQARASSHQLNQKSNQKNAAIHSHNLQELTKPVTVVTSAQAPSRRTHNHPAES